MSASDDRSGDPGRGQMAFARAFPLLVFTLCAVGVIVVLAFRNFAALSQSATVYDALAPVCGSTAASSEAAAWERPSELQVVAFVVSESGLVQAAREMVPDQWQPQSAAEVDLVLCLRRERPAYRPLCDNAAIVNQVGLEMEGELRLAASGAVVAAGLITSDPRAEPPCLRQTLSVDPEEGSPFPSGQVQAWLAKQLAD